MDLLQRQAAPKCFCNFAPCHGMMASWERGRPARTKPGTASAISPTWIDRGTTPWLSFGLTDAVPADRVAACSIALKLSGGQRDRMRAGRPRSQGNHSPLEGESQKPSRQAKADAVGGGRRVTSQKADLHPLGNSRLPASRAPALACGSFEREATNLHGLSGTRTTCR